MSTPSCPHHSVCTPAREIPVLSHYFYTVFIANVAPYHFLSPSLSHSRSLYPALALSIPLSLSLYPTLALSIPLSPSLSRSRPLYPTLALSIPLSPSLSHSRSRSLNHFTKILKRRQILFIRFGQE